MSLGESLGSIAKRDWTGGPCPTNDNYPANGSATVGGGGGRRYSVVTFADGPRRHSSPASVRRKESGNTLYTEPGHRIEEEEEEASKENLLSHQQGGDNPGGSGASAYITSLNPASGQIRAAYVNSHRKRSILANEPPSLHSTIEEDESERRESSTTATSSTLDKPATKGAGLSEEPLPVQYFSRIRPPLRRNNTDDSEVEKRVAKLIKEIEMSATDTENSRNNSTCSAHYCCFHQRRVETRDIGVQTLTQEQLTDLYSQNEAAGACSREEGSSASLLGKEDKKKRFSPLARVLHGFTNLGRKGTKSADDNKHNGHINDCEEV